MMSPTKGGEGMAQKSQKIVTSFMDSPFLMIFKIQLLILKYLIFSLKVPAK